MVFGKLSAMSAVIRLNTGALASILVQAMKNKGDTCIIEYLGEDEYSLVVTCLDADGSNGNWRWDEYFSFDFFKGKDRLYTVDCGVDLADLDVNRFREYYLQIGGTDWEIVVKEENHAENLVQLQAF